MKFIADAMLGSLAKWLRLLGLDVLYYPDIEDREVIKISREQNRIIITRDTRMLQRRGVRDAVFIRSDHLSEQLLDVKDAVDLRDSDLMQRCVACNGTLHEVSDSAEVQDQVPDYIYHNFKSFLRCDGCGKVYWEGSHYKKIRERINEILKTSNED